MVVRSFSMRARVFGNSVAISSRETWVPSKRTYSARTPIGITSRVFRSFRPPYRATSKLHIYELDRNDERIVQSLLEQLRPGYFPVTPTALKAQITTEYFEHAETHVNDVWIRYLEQTHTGA